MPRSLGAATLQLDRSTRLEEEDAPIPTPESKVQKEEESPLPEPTSGKGPIRRKRPVVTREQYMNRAPRPVESDEVMGAHDPTEPTSAESAAEAIAFSATCSSSKTSTENACRARCNKGSEA
ncbi:MAG: hypothetical protein Q9196_005909, partial [Gyalolechia fulgens]